MLPMTAVPPAQPPQPYLRHGSGPELAIERRVERDECIMDEQKGMCVIGYE